MIGRGFRGRTGAVLGGTALAALLGGSLVAPAQAAPVAAPGECPATMTAAQATTGLVGQGLTVVKGNTPEPFRVDVLGVLEDGIGAGRDMVLIKVSDLPGRHVIDQGGGIWAGMSGSPVYVGNKLLGSVSYGFTLAPSPIGGLTPAADMADLLGLGTGATAARTAATAAEGKEKVKLSSATRRAVEKRAGVAVPSSSIEQLPSPFAVSGVRGARLKRLQKDVATADLPLRVYASGRASAAKAGAAPASRPTAGGNFASVLSYGDVTAASVGTTTYVCRNQALAYGHPDQFAGPVGYGANDADALAIVKDNTVGSFKQANVKGSFGTVDQDRLAGVRTNLTTTPSTAPITTTITNHDTGRSRTGTTQVAARNLLPALTPYALWANYDSTFDELGDGRLSEGWTITGTRAGGKAFSVSRTNKFADQEDVTFEPALELADAVYALSENDAEKVTISSVRYDAVVATAFRQVHLTKVEVSTNGGKSWSSPRALSVKAGAKLSVRTTVKPYQGTTAITKVSTLTVPKSAKGQVGALTVEGGSTATEDEESDDTACLLDESCDESDDPTLDQVIAGLKATPRNDDLVVSLRAEDEDSKSDEESSSLLASTRVRQPEVVTGSRSIDVLVR